MILPPPSVALVPDAVFPAPPRPATRLEQAALEAFDAWILQDDTRVAELMLEIQAAAKARGLR